MTNPIESPAADVGAELQYVAPTQLFGREIGTNDSPPRYVWIPKGGPLTGRKTATITLGGKIYPVAQNIKLAFDVNCWGKDPDQAWHLFTALVTVLRRLMSASAIPGNVEIGKPSFSVLGIVVVLPIVIDVPILEADIPTAGPEKQGATDIEQTTLTKPATFTEATPPLSTAGDGVLEGTES